MMIDELIARAEDLRKEKNYSAAISVFDQVLEQDINNKAAWIGKGLCLGGLGYYHEAICCLEKAPNDKHALFACGSYLFGLELYQDALILFNLVWSQICDDVSDTPGNKKAKTNVLLYRGAAAYQLGKYKLANQLYHQALRINPALKEDRWLRKASAFKLLSFNAENVMEMFKSVIPPRLLSLLLSIIFSQLIGFTTIGLLSVALIAVIGEDIAIPIIACLILSLPSILMSLKIINIKKDPIAYHPKDIENDIDEKYLHLILSKKNTIRHKIIRLITYYPISLPWNLNLTTTILNHVFFNNWLAFPPDSESFSDFAATLRVSGDYSWIYIAFVHLLLVNEILIMPTMWISLLSYIMEFPEIMNLLSLQSDSTQKENRQMLSLQRKMTDLLSKLLQELAAIELRTKQDLVNPYNRLYYQERFRANLSLFKHSLLELQYVLKEACLPSLQTEVLNLALKTRNKLLAIRLVTSTSQTIKAVDEELNELNKLFKKYLEDHNKYRQDIGHHLSPLGELTSLIHNDHAVLTENNHHTLSMSPADLNHDAVKKLCRFIESSPILRIYPDEVLRDFYHQEDEQNVLHDQTNLSRPSKQKSGKRKELITNIEEILNEKRDIFEQWPSFYDFAYLACHVYEPSCKLEAGWEALEVNIEDNGYLGIIYVNDVKRQLVLCHRGTVASLTNFNATINTLNVDAEGVINDIITALQRSAFKISERLTYYADKLKYSASCTGHSLGAWLAQITAYELQKKGRHIRVCAIDSPGCEEMLEKLQPRFADHIDLNELDIVELLSAPNVVNVCNTHVGKGYRIYPDLSDYYQRISGSQSKKSWWELLLSFAEKNNYSILYDCEAHKIEKIRDCIKQNPHNVHEIVTWPRMVRRRGKSIKDSLIESIVGSLVGLTNYSKYKQSNNTLQNILKMYKPTGKLKSTSNLAQVIYDFYAGNINLSELNGFKIHGKALNVYHDVPVVVSEPDDYFMERRFNYKVKALEPNVILDAVLFYKLNNNIKQFLLGYKKYVEKIRPYEYKEGFISDFAVKLDRLVELKDFLNSYVFETSIKNNEQLIVKLTLSGESINGNQLNNAHKREYFVNQIHYYLLIYPELLPLLTKAKHQKYEFICHRIEQLKMNSEKIAQQIGKLQGKTRERENLKKIQEGLQEELGKLQQEQQVLILDEDVSNFEKAKALTLNPIHELPYQPMLGQSLHLNPSLQNLQRELFLNAQIQQAFMTKFGAIITDIQAFINLQAQSEKNAIDLLSELADCIKNDIDMFIALIKVIKKDVHYLSAHQQIFARKKISRSEDREYSQNSLNKEKQEILQMVRNLLMINSEEALATIAHSTKELEIVSKKADELHLLHTNVKAGATRLQQHASRNRKFSSSFTSVLGNNSFGSPVYSSEPRPKSTLSGQCYFLEDGRLINIISKQLATGDGNCGFRSILGQNYLHGNLLTRQGVVDLLKNNLDDPETQKLIAKDLIAKYQEWVSNDWCMLKDLLFPGEIKQVFEEFRRQEVSDPKSTMQEIEKYCQNQDVITSYLERYLIHDQIWPHIQGSLAAFAQILGIKLVCFQEQANGELINLKDMPQFSRDLVEEVFIVQDLAQTHFDRLEVEFPVKDLSRQFR